jgi:hypothetical protein
MPRNSPSGILMSSSQYWRKRAERLRRVAAETIEPESKQALLKLAYSYELLAQRADERAEEGQLLGQ